MKLRSLAKLICIFSVQGAALFSAPFRQTNLVSDIPGLAANLDPSLVNPWGISHSATSPFWVSDQGTNKSTLYNGFGVPQALVVTTPPVNPPPTGPTGQVFANIAGNFLDGGAPATFIFATLSGTIDAWNSGNGTTAAVAHTTPGAVYTGLAIGNNGANLLYAANFGAGHIDVFNSSFAPTTVPGPFVDPMLPPGGYVPYNIQNIGGKLYVEYAKVDPVTHKALVQAGVGVVAVFDTNGGFLQQISAGGALNAPWGVAIAPAGFGQFGGDILVGNFGDGTINAYDPTTGMFLGSLTDASGNPIVNDGLWALEFGNGGTGFNANALYITAGIQGETHGLFAEIQAVPEPGAMALLGLGFLGIAAIARRRRS
jgi:uncharacterized protein (TIGR03118 family)